MKVIYKYVIPPDGITISMASGSEILTVDEQQGQITIWVLSDPSRIDEDRHYIVRGTGMAIDSGWDYIGTAQVDPFIWHLFEMSRNERF